MATSSLVRRNTRSRRGFSLVEMMCVLAVVSVLASLIWPAVVGMVAGDRLSNNAYMLSNVLQQARATAIARHTYVWVGFQSYNDANGVPAVMVASVAGNSGQTSDLPANTVLTEKPTILKNVALTAQTNYQILPGYDSSVTTQDVASQGYSFQISVAGNANTTFGDVIAFGPDGQVNLAQASSGTLQLVQCLGMGLQQAPSSTKLHVAAIQVRGLSGEVSVLRQ
ncbi:MAG TPA: prepilin-type N-terminal cleavage/methylation domain-containing protein [Candidatus Methylacidiphilales bacterium]|nr:prepilin-type N-terminal cleavage/methylation domain-containing protein [Candidatus Methylacidiphilales bacterium]